ncbi:MAG: hypothetical protein L0206_17310 [Actinobacteria bacterium]|nr:hypothetical protein [Actinomycetota bacterium]
MKAVSSGCARCGGLTTNIGTGLCDHCELIQVMRSQRRKYAREERLTEVPRRR